MCWSHRWRDHMRVYSGKVDFVKSNSIMPRDLERLNFGFTTIIQQCIKCGQYHTIEVMGDARLSEAQEMQQQQLSDVYNAPAS